MQKIIILISLCILASCGSKEMPQAPSPYPSVPMQIGSSASVDPTPSPIAVASGSSYIARGTEPFWTVDVAPSMSTLTRPAETTNIAVEYDTEQSDKGSIISIKSVKGDFFVTLTKGTCSDGMSDTAYTYTATVNVGAEELKGCANKK